MSEANKSLDPIVLQKRISELEAKLEQLTERAALAAEKHALSEGWSHSSALRFRNCILALGK